MLLMAWMAVGVLAGLVLSKVFHQGRSALIADVVLGVYGAMVGGFVFNLLRMHGSAAFNGWSVMFAGVGAMAMVTAVDTLRRTGHG